MTFHKSKTGILEAESSENRPGGCVKRSFQPGESSPRGRQSGRPSLYGAMDLRLQTPVPADAVALPADQAMPDSAAFPPERLGVTPAVRAVCPLSCDLGWAGGVSPAGEIENGYQRNSRVHKGRTSGFYY